MISRQRLVKNTTSYDNPISAEIFDAITDNLMGIREMDMDSFLMNTARDCFLGLHRMFQETYRRT